MKPLLLAVTIAVASAKECCGVLVQDVQEMPAPGVGDVRRALDERNAGRESQEEPEESEGSAPSEAPAPIPEDKVVFETVWPANDHTLGGAIGRYRPSIPIGNGTCTVTFPSEPALFHAFNAHIRVDEATTNTVWKICAANPTFEPSPEDGSFSWLVQFNRGFEFEAKDVTWECDNTDEYTWAVYSFPQNLISSTGRSNIRPRGDFVPNQALGITFPSPVANFTVDDYRVTVTTTDNLNYILENIPNVDEVWFQFEYENFFQSNEVGVVSA